MSTCKMGLNKYGFHIDSGLGKKWVDQIRKARDSGGVHIIPNCVASFLNMTAVSVASY